MVAGSNPVTPTEIKQACNSASYGPVLLFHKAQLLSTGGGGVKQAPRFFPEGIELVYKYSLFIDIKGEN